MALGAPLPFALRALGLLLVLAVPARAESPSAFSVHSIVVPFSSQTGVAPIYMPEILRALRSLEPSASPATARIRTTRGAVSKSIPHRFLKHPTVAKLHGGSFRGIEALVVSGGTTDIRSLARSPQAMGHLECQDDICDLTAPLFVEADAALTLDGVTLRMHRGDGAFIASLGKLLIRNSHLLTPPEAGCTFEAPYTSFRPFIAGLTGSRTVAIASQFTDLGYHAPKTYGFSVHAGKHEPPPSAILVGNVFEGLYYGFYSHHAKNVTIAGNIYRDNIIYGIDPHDYTEDLYILGNRAYGTKKKHGIVISRGVTRTTISGNYSYENNGTGIMLDRHSNDNLISYNLTSDNGIDGISVLESSNSKFVRNTAFGNRKAGIRVRNGRDLLIAENNLVSNGAYGTILYTAEPNGVVRREEDVFEKRTNATLIANYVSGNETTDLQVKGCVDRLDFDLAENRQPGFIDRKVGLPVNKNWQRILSGLSGKQGTLASIRYSCPQEEGEAVDNAKARKKAKAGASPTVAENCTPGPQVPELN